MAPDDPGERVADQFMTLLISFPRKFLPKGDGPFDSLSERQAMQFRTLRVLSMIDDPKMSTISQVLFISRPYMTTLIDSLVHEGYVQRQRAAEDRRVVRIIITAEGRRHLAEGTAIFRGHIAKRFSALGEEDLLLLSESLGNLQTILAKIR